MSARCRIDQRIQGLLQPRIKLRQRFAAAAGRSQIVIAVPSHLVGHVYGKQGKKLTQMRKASGAIDRRAVVARYPLLTAVDNATQLDPADVFTLGYGDFVYNVDATGLQTFNTSFSTRGPALDLNTMSSWAFHSTPASPDARAALESFNWTTYPTPISATDVRPITLATDANNTGPLALCRT